MSDTEKNPDLPPPPGPGTGIAAMILGDVALVAAILGYFGSAVTLKHALLAAVPFSLLGLFLGVAGFRHVTGKIAVVQCGLILLAAAGLIIVMQFNIWSQP